MRIICGRNYLLCAFVSITFYGFFGGVEPIKEWGATVSIIYQLSGIKVSEELQLLVCRRFVLESSTKYVANTIKEK